MPSLGSLVGIFLATSLWSTGVLGQDRTTEAGEAAITDPNTECTAYDLPLVTDNAANFPAIWQSATILPNDAAALALWNTIAPTIPPNISVKGTLAGDFTNTTATYPTTDPDCWWTYSTCTTPKQPGLPPDIISVPEPNTLGYGFDDGPNCSHNAFYDFLTSQNQKATMFYIGSNVMDWPLEAQRAAADGHEICVHTWSHQYMTAFQSEDAFAELYYTMQALKLITGRTPRCWRPPFGDVDDRIRTIAHGLGLQTIIWSYDTNDWQEGSGNVTAADIDANYQNIINLANNGTFNEAGTIVLTHELNNFTMSEAIKFYPMLKAAFKYLVPVGVGLNITQPYVETNITQPTFEQYISGVLVTNGTTNAAAGSSSPSSSTTPTATASSKPKSNAAKHLNALQDRSVLAATVLLLSGLAALI
jgi:hypothetical protein